MSNQNLENRPKSGESEKRRERRLISLMARLALTLGVEISKERVILYIRPLSDLSDYQLSRAFEIAEREYKPYGGSFPSPGELREYAMRPEYRGAPDDSKEILSRADKPPDWEPLSVDEIKRQLADACKWPS